MSSIKPSPQTWTLRCKSGRLTILLHVDPLQKLGTLKADLLKALHQTQPSGQLNGITIPAKPDDILLAKAVDINDLSAGWESIELNSETLLDGDDSGKGKGKAGATTSAAKKSGVKGAAKDSPQGAGLRDGGIVAFKFRSERERMYPEWKRVDGDGDDMEIADDDDEKKEEWDVVVPTLEETYGESLTVAEEDEAGG